MTEIGKAYGSALFLLASDEGKDGELMEQLETVCGLLNENPDFTRLMSSPNIRKPERLKILEDTFGGRVDSDLLSFMCILTENGAFEELPSCEEEYRARFYDRHGITSVTAVTAAPMSQNAMGALTERLEGVTGKTVILKNRIDPSCIGGVRLEMDGRLMDGSVKGRLEAIKDKLLQAKA